MFRHSLLALLAIQVTFAADSFSPEEARAQLHHSVQDTSSNQPQPRVGVHSVMNGGPEQDCSIVLSGDYGLNVSIPWWGGGYIMVTFDPNTWQSTNIKTYTTWPFPDGSQTAQLLKDVQALGNGTKALVAVCDASSGDSGGGIEPVQEAMALLGSTEFSQQLAEGSQLRVAFAMLGEKGGSVTKEVYDKSWYESGVPSNVVLTIPKGAHVCSASANECNTCSACCKDYITTPSGCEECFVDECK